MKNSIAPLQKHTALPRLGPVALMALAFFLGTARVPAVTLLGNPFRPAGANYQIYAVQGIDDTHKLGDNTAAPQVNRDFEFQGATGVSYDTGGGKLTDFGIGLYQPSKNGATFSTGLNIKYDQAVLASSVTVRLEDFDINAGATFFNPGKVEPSILIFGPGNSILASATPMDIFPNLKPVTGTGKSTDVWDLNFGDLLNTLHLADSPISGFLLYADTHDGEKANSDPYLLVSIGNGIPAIPEAGNYVVGLAAAAFAGLFHVRQLRLKKKATL